MISNPFLFGSTPKNYYPSKSNGHLSPSSVSNQDMEEHNGGDSNSGAQKNQESNPITARFVIAKRGMDVILECHDHVVTTSQEGSMLDNKKDTGRAQDATLDDQNYVWRKEGGVGICFTLQVYI